MLIIFPVLREHPPLFYMSKADGTSSYEGDNFVLDQQVVRAALKSYRNLFDSKNPSAINLSPSSSYLRLLLNLTSRPSVATDASWREGSTIILLLEWRAALIVNEYAQNAKAPDASVNQRVSKAVSEAFVATQVGEILKSLQQSGLQNKEAEVLSNVYLLVRVFSSIYQVSL